MPLPRRMYAGAKLTFHAPIPPAPSLLTPANGGTVGLPVQLSWTPDPNPQTEGYQVEINRTPNFGGGCGGVEECITGLSQPRDLLGSLPAGIHYWRVRSFHGLAGPDREAATGWSAARSFTVSDAPPAVRSLTIDVFTEGGVALSSHTHVFSGTNEDNEAFGTVQLTTPAPRGGASITLASSDPAVAAIRPSVTVPAGHGQATFRIRPGQVPQSAAVTLSATLNGHAATAPLTVAPASLGQGGVVDRARAHGESREPRHRRLRRDHPRPRSAPPVHRAAADRADQPVRPARCPGSARAALGAAARARLPRRPS